MAPHSNTVDISVFITYKWDKGDAFFRFDKMTIKSRGRLFEDAKRLGLPSYQQSEVVLPGRVVRVVYSDVHIHEPLYTEILDAVQPLTRRDRELNKKILAELDIEEIKLVQDPPPPVEEERHYSSPAKRPYELSDRYHGSSASSSPYKKARRDSHSDFHSERQYDDRNTSYSGSRSHPGAEYEAENKAPTASLLDRVDRVKQSEGSLVERISPAPATFKPLANRLDTRDPSPSAAPPLSARISDPAPSASTTSAHLGHHNISLSSNAAIIPTSSVSRSKSSEGTPASSGEVHAPPTDPHSFHGGAIPSSSDPFYASNRPSHSQFAPPGGPQSQSVRPTGTGSAGHVTPSPTDTIPRADPPAKDVGSSSRFGPPLDAPPINTRFSSIASSRQVTPGSALHPGATPGSFPVHATARAPSVASKEGTPAPVTLNLGASDTHGNAAPSPATSIPHDRVESYPPATGPHVPSNAIPMDVDTSRDVGVSKISSKEPGVEAPKLPPPFAMPPVTCSTNAQNEMLRAEISKLTEELKYTKQELEYERRRRKEAEAVAEDVMRECREPFVVPALMDAFIQVSKLTTTVRKIAS